MNTDYKIHRKLYAMQLTVNIYKLHTCQHLEALLYLLQAPLLIVESHLPSVNVNLSFSGLHSILSEYKPN